MIRRFGVLVHAFDPTPRAIAWIRGQFLPENFVFHEYGISDHDGNAAFHPPENEGFVSYSIFARGRGDDVIQAPVYRLTTIMKLLGQETIDVLKMDVEGAEKYVFAENYQDWLGKVDAIVIEIHGHECADVFHRAIGPFGFEVSTCDELTVARRREVKSVV